MRFSFEVFLNLFNAYLGLLKSALTTSWLLEFGTAFSEPTVSNKNNTAVQTPEMIRGWLNWRPESVAAIIAWILSFILLLTVVGPTYVIIAAVKTLLWCIGFIPAVLICALCALRFERAAAE